jgi:hypothetical protein
MVYYFMSFLSRFCTAIEMDDENSTITEDVSSSSSFEFILLLIVEIPSIICTLLILTYLFRNWYTMVIKSLRNHVILILIIISLINTTLDLPFTINSYRLGYDNPRTLSFCHWWYWLDYTLIVTSIFLTAIASVQRHFLIFHAHWLRIRRIRWALHYVPLIFCLLYPLLYYFIFIIVYQCKNDTINDSQYCVQPCYTNDPVLFNYDWVFNTAFPLMTIALANIILIVRVIRSMRKTRRRQSLIWKRQRKLTLQLLALSLLYIVGWAPSTILSIIGAFFFRITVWIYHNWIILFVLYNHSYVFLVYRN